MDPWEDFTISNLLSSQSHSFSKSYEIKEIKKMLLSGDEQGRSCAVSNVLFQMADDDGAIEMINSDICEFLCNAILPFDSSISETIYNCLEIMVKFEEFFTHNHSCIAIGSVIRTINLLIKHGAYDSTVRYPLQTLKLIIQRYAELNKAPEKNFENVTGLLLVLLKNNPGEEVKYRTGEIIKFLLDMELGNLKIADNLRDVCEKWFDVICVRTENFYSVPRRIVNLGCAVSEKTLRYLSKKVVTMDQTDKNKVLESVDGSHIIKKIITFLLEFSLPYIQTFRQRYSCWHHQWKLTYPVGTNTVKKIGSCAVEEQEIQRLEHYFMSLSFILKDFPEKRRITQKLSAMGFIQLISNILSFSYRRQCRKLGKICVAVLTESLLSLSFDVFLFPDMWPKGRDHFSNGIINGLSLISSDSTRWAENLVEVDIHPSTKLALIIYFFFHSLTSKSLPFSEGVRSSMVKFVTTSLEKDSSPLEVKVIWFIYATLHMSQNPLRPDFSNWDHKKLFEILESQVNFSLIYTHHPVILNWALSPSTMNRKIQYEVVKLWMRQRSTNCTVLDDLVKKFSNVRLVLFEILQDEHEYSTHSAFVYLKNFMLESGDEALSWNIWFTLPQTLEKYTTDTTNAIKVGYTIELATLRVPESPDMCKIVEITSLLPKALEKTDLVSLTPALKLSLQLLQMSDQYEEPRVLYEFLRCERFTQKIVSAIDMNMSEAVITSLKFIALLWSKSLNFGCLPCNYNKITLNAYSVLETLNSTPLELVKTGLAVLEQMLATDFQSHIFAVQGLSSDFIKIVLFDLENLLIRYLRVISGSVWICLRHCISLNNQGTLAEDALLHELIKYCLPYLKDTPEMMDFLIIWIERRKELEKYFISYSPMRESFFIITVRGIADYLAENNFENSERLCQKILECCDHFLIDTNQDPFNKIRTRIGV